MFSTTYSGQTSKASVSILNSNQQLELYFNYNDKHYYIYTNLTDTAANRKLVKVQALNIENDILYERFDISLDKYQTNFSLSTITAIQKSKLQLDQLWNKYSEFKKPQISPSTYAQDFTKHKNHIAKLPTRSLNDASAIRDYLLANLTPDAAKRCLTQIKACCNWAIEVGLIDANPFATMKIKVPKNKSQQQDVQPFSKEERDLIIHTFSKDRYYSYYTNYVRFLFFTGCKPSEAVALRWKHITNSVIQFRQSVVISEHGLIQKDGLKTQGKRDFPLTLEVKAILEDVKPEVVDPESLIFISPKGKFIDHHNFSNRAWKSILAKSGIPYRKSYQTRHTFINLCIEAHINNTVICRWTGTSARMIDEHYAATNFTHLMPPDLS